MKLNYKSYSFLILGTLFLFSCDSNEDEMMPPTPIAKEEIKPIEFTANFNPVHNTIGQKLLPIPKLSWSVINRTQFDDITYEISLGTSPSDLTLIHSSSQENHQIKSLLDPELEYFWQISFINRDGKKIISETNSFTTSKIEFADPIVEQIIREALAQPQGDFTRDKLEKITHIPIDTTVADYTAHRAYDGYIEDLTGLEYCINLNRVNLMQNAFRSPISDLTPLQNLTSITYLNVANNKVNDLTPLSNLINLKFLHLGWNTGISDITPLANLKKLKTLDLTYTHSLRDITPIEKLTQLDSLNYSHSYYIENISSIGKLVNLKHLRFTGSEIIKDFTFLNELTKLESLHLDRNSNIKDLSFVSNMPQLKKLNISGTGITDISILSRFTAMEFLSLRGLKISDFSVLRKMPNLKELHFDDDAIDDSIISTREILNMFPSGIKLIINNSIINR